MATTKAKATKTSKTAMGPRQPTAEAAPPAPEFPGCTPVHLPAEELECETGADLLDRVAGKTARRP